MMPLLRPENIVPRSDALADFVASSPAADAEISLLAGDASFRKYWRATRGACSWVVMDAPPEHEDVRPFIKITNLLQRAGLCVPRIQAQDESRGFLLLEDLGDVLYSSYLSEHSHDEGALYQHACEALIRLHRASAREQAITQHLKPYDHSVYLREVGLFTDWFLVQVHGREGAQALQRQWQQAWREVLADTPLTNEVLVHRDYHADNLLWLPDHTLKVGILDYQDALLGDPLYDVISLLEDARRDVGAATVTACKKHIRDVSGIAEDVFAHRYDVLAAQRNAKIIGIFVRLCVRDGKARYLDYLPRVWGHFMRDIAHPALLPVKQFVQMHVPAEYHGAFVPDVSRGGLP